MSRAVDCEPIEHAVLTIRMTAGKDRQSKIWATSTDHKEKTTTTKSERLNRLDRELMVEKTKDFDYLNIVGHGFRVRVCVMRNEDGKCYATAQVGDRAFRYGGGYAPSAAVLMLMIVIRRFIAEMPSMKRRELENA